MVKVLYYVDERYNTKDLLAAFPLEKDLRSKENLKHISDTLHSASFGNVEMCDQLAWDVAHNGTAQVTCQMGTYSFGFENIEYFP